MADDRAFLTALILDALCSGSRDLEEISEHVGGAYLADLSILLEELAHVGKVAARGGRYRRVDIEPLLPLDDPRQRPTVLSLPLPHPADMDWRFAPNTASAICDYVCTHARAEGRVLLIGAPSIFAELHCRVEVGSVDLLDLSPALRHYLCTQTLRPGFRVLSHDLLDPKTPIDRGTYAVVVCDPPWYPEHYLGCLLHASNALQVGGRAYVSLLPPTARPNATADRCDVVVRGARLGLHLVRLDAGVLRYQTPSFEAKSLKQAGLTASPDWRVGDLAVFNKVHHVFAKERQPFVKELVRLNTSKADWCEFMIGSSKVKVRGPFDWEDEPKLLRIEPDDVLPTVSRRYANRDRIDLWLTDNRVFGLTCKAAFRTALERLSEGTLGGRRSEIRALKVEAAARLIAPIVEWGDMIGSRSPHMKAKAILSGKGTMTLSAASAAFRDAKIRGHLCIMQEPYFSKLLRGEKTIESRFSDRRFAPFEVVEPGDLLVLQNGARVAIGSVTAAKYHGPLDAGEASSIMKTYEKELRIESKFRQLKGNSRFATLLWVEGVEAVNGVRIHKRDRRGWVVL